MSRSYKGILAKTHRVYSGENLQKLFNVSANTISNWVKGGLEPTDNAKPYLFNGSAVIRFHKARLERTKINLRTGEFKCFGCKLAVFPELSTMFERQQKNGSVRLVARCPECGSYAFKFPTQADRDLLAGNLNPNTTVDCPHEENEQGPGGIGTISNKTDRVIRSANDRIVYKWQFYCGKFEESTTDAYLRSIRLCEQVNSGKPFEKYTIADVSYVRDCLVKSLNAEDASRKSKSTIRHIVSQLTRFF